MSPPTVFLSYSHHDEVWKKRLATHLSVLELEGFLSVWGDRRIGAGSEWRREVEAAILRAEVALLLISASFLGSPFIRQRDVPELLERRSRDGLHVVPVIIRDCAWKSVTALSALAARPSTGNLSTPSPCPSGKPNWRFI